MWIEIDIGDELDDSADVTPFTGVWIEICGKYLLLCAIIVTPFTGVWIEIPPQSSDIE